MCGWVSEWGATLLLAVQGRETKVVQAEMFDTGSVWELVDTMWLFKTGRAVLVWFHRLTASTFTPVLCSSTSSELVTSSMVSPYLLMYRTR